MEEALVEMCLAGVSVRCVEDISLQGDDVMTLSGKAAKSHQDRGAAG